MRACRHSPPVQTARQGSVIVVVPGKLYESSLLLILWVSLTVLLISVCEDAHSADSAFEASKIQILRFVAGLGVGALSAIVPLYIGEAAPKKLRGSLLVLYQVQIISGLFLEYIINLGTHHINNST
ncbi:hypothetical protein V865_003298 [Kwoniella europaea PYCC6329]|uniref:Major facilitator superfamily (MFS) profile domain-containing protein n=1 Tax=Kwoniella europaea PYCC6329 TaxID=1423913 RepID=A0AAX4KFS2_9TREE